MTMRKTGKALVPHNTKRPAKQSIKTAIEAGDINRVVKHLTPRQKAFCQEYVVDFNATQATIRAGYSPKNADKQGYLNLMNEGIRAYISDLTLSKQAKIVSVTPDYIVQKINEIIQKDDGKDADKLRGLELLARHLGMFIDRTEISGKDGEAIKIERAEAESAELKKAIERLARRNDVLTVVPDDETQK